MKLDVMRHVVRPGGVIQARIENDSAESITYGLAFGLQRFEDGRWVRLPEKPAFSVRLGLPAGEVGPWQAIPIPVKAISGRYRVRKSVSRVDPDHRKEVALYGYFRVCTECDIPSAARTGPCAQATEVDYEAPLAGLPPLPRNTASNGLRVGPPRLRLTSVGQKLNLGKGHFGYKLAVSAPTIQRPVSLDGDTELELSRIDRQGRIVETVSARRQALGVVAGASFNGKSFLVDVPARPGLYLFQARLLDAQGEAVGRYADYLRVLRPVTDVRLVVSGDSVRPGSRVSFWVENRGTEKLDPMGRAFAFEVFEGGSWSIAPGSPEVFPKVGHKPLSGGEAGACDSFEIPPEARPGLYRFRKKVILSSGAKKRLAAEFRVSS